MTTVQLTEKNMESITELRKFVGKQRERSEENRNTLLVWVRRWGWTTNQIAGRLLDLQRPALCDEFTKRGLLDKIAAPPGHRERFVYILNQNGLKIVEELLDKYASIMNFAPYTLHESKRIAWTIHEHNMCAQHILLDILGPRPEINLYVTDLEYRQENKNDESVPDFSYISNDGLALCEIELNQKSELRFKRWLYLRVKYLIDNQNDEVIIYTQLNGVANLVNKLLSNKYIYQVQKGKESGKLVERQDKIGIELTKDLKTRIQIKMLMRDENRKSGGLSLYEDEDFDI